MSVRVCTQVLAMLLLLSPVGVAWAVIVDLDLGMRHESNVTRAQNSSDQEHDTALVLGSHARYPIRLDALTSISVEGGLAGRWWTRFDDVSQLSGELGLRVRRRAGLGFAAPWLELSLQAFGLKHKDSEIRDGGVLRSGLTAGRRFGAQLNARLGYAYQVRRAAEDVVFDLEQHEAFAQLDVQLGPRWLLYFELGAIEGEIVSTASLSNPRIRGSANVLPRDPDEAFGLGHNRSTNASSPRWTYQIDGTIVTAEVGLNYPLKPGLALDIAARYVQAYAAGDNEYAGYIVNAGLLWQFH